MHFQGTENNIRLLRSNFIVSEVKMKESAAVVQLKSVFTKRIPFRNIQFLKGSKSPAGTDGRPRSVLS